ncbi:MFS transporter [Rhodococcus pyridinivorans]|uniref:MFS transporter n=1 Tax=Rhodococcus TaxID=1827 RepID=UPI0007EA22E2|nr:MULTISPECIES: MFS transporter [Rhodococcus]APE07954.1 hypothetical protein BO226_00880 [Rhodococcus sp. 2G]MCD2116033.1 MFS transporter [Rhodococcus pyridinivorans]MCW3469034.1 MFS transporter [Rhodococcus pyridinivorans]MCZ4624897.1 MFS transporter [Rhodococcus pyridinivorans]MCZ4646107.1 MFS transporter [Rhodococcus pyridinivorans]
MTASADVHLPGRPRANTSVLVLVSLAVTVVIFNNTAVNVALPAMAAELTLSDAAMRLVVVSYSVTFAALLLPAGYVCGRWGARRALVTGLWVASLGACAAWAVPTEIGVIAGRTLIGAGAAFVMPATLAVAVETSPPERRSRAIAVWTAVSVAGAAGGPVLGGALVDTFGWVSIFVAVTCSAAAVAVTVTVGVPPLAPQRTDGFAVFTTFLRILGTAPLLVALTVLSDLPVIALVCVVVSASAWVTLAWRRRRRPHGGSAPAGWETRSFLGASVANMLMFFAVAGSLFVLTQLLQYAFGFSPFAAGLAVTPVTIAMIVGTILSGPLASAWGVRAGAVGGLLVVASAALSIALLPAAPVGVTIAAVTVAGTGVGVALPLVTESMVASAPPSRVGDAAAVNDTMQEIGFSAGVAVVGGALALAYRFAGTGSGDAAAAGLVIVDARAAGDAVALAEAVAEFRTATQWAFSAAALVVGIGAVVAFRLLPPRRTINPSTT